jgi:2-methylcitrate dehydratase PrpD
MRHPHTETRRLAEFAAAIDCAALPEGVVERAKRVIADALACGVAGLAVAPEVAEPVGRYARALGGVREATVIGEGWRTSAPVAALVNATRIHSIDFDDTHMPAVAHFGAPVVSAALAATERRGGGGADLISAVVAGLEVGGKVGRSVMPGHYQRFHSTASLGGLAAAGAAARGLGLDAEKTDMAVSFAADDTGGTRYCIKVGDFSKSLHAGTAAWKGLQGALLAEAGANGPTGLLEHPVGFFWAYSEEREPDRFAPELERLGEVWEVMEVDIKAYPCILAAHTAVEATVGIVTEHDLAPDEVAEIRVRYPFFSDNHGLNYEPGSVMAARLSIPYCVAVAAMDRTVGLAQFEGERYRDARMREFMSRVYCEADRCLNERYLNAPAAVVELRAASGEAYRREIVYPRGSHRRPLSDEEHREKLRELFGKTLPTSTAEGMIALCGDLEHRESLEDLVGLLGGKERVS